MTTKNDIAAKIQENTGLSQRQALVAVNTVLAEVQDSLARHEKVSFSGFGTFDVRDRAPRKGHNPQTGEEIDIAAATVPFFHAGQTLRRAVKDGEDD